MLEEHRDLCLVHDFGNNQKTISVGGQPQHLPTFLAHALKTVRRRSGLERSTTQDFDAAFVHHTCNGHDLLSALYRAWPCHHDHVVTADFGLTAGRSNTNDCPVRLECAAG